jgi:hypothetical protein
LAFALTVGRVSHKGDVTRSLDGYCQCVLVAGAVATDAAGKDFSALCYEFFEFVRVFVVYKVHFVCTEAARFATSWQSILIATHS